MHYGYPGTTALPAVDYMLLDAVAAPPSHATDFTERLAYMPHSHFVAAHSARYPDVPRTTRLAQPWEPSSTRRVAASDGGDAHRKDLGLGVSPGRLDGFSMVNFNQLYKMDATTYAAWCNALHRLPRAFLWLSRVTVRKDSSYFAEANIMAEVRRTRCHPSPLAGERRR